MIQPDIELARRLEQSISLAPDSNASATESIYCGSFRAWFTAYTNNRELNYAMPVAPIAAAAMRVEVEGLRSVFTARHRTVRVEYVEELWPGLRDALEQVGLHLAAAEPLMACTRTEFLSSTAPGVQMRALSVADDDADLAAFTQIRDARPLDGSRPASARAITELRALLQTRTEVCALACVDGVPAASGRCLLQRDSLGELTSIVTRPQFRRRGVAATMVSFLIRELIDTGRTIAWLNAANDQARSVYARLGFRSIGRLLNYEEGHASEV